MPRMLGDRLEVGFRGLGFGDLVFYQKAEQVLVIKRDYRVLSVDLAILSIGS